MPSALIKEDLKENLINSLVRKGLVSQKVVTEANLESIRTGRALETVLLERGLVKSEDIQQARAESVGIPFKSLRDVKISPDVANYVSEQLARRYIIIPFEVDTQNHFLSLSMKDPLDLQLIQFIEQKTGFKINPFFTSEGEIKTAIETVYAANLSKDVKAAIQDVGGVVEGQEVLSDLGKVNEVIKEAPVARIVSAILEYAIKGRASDVHIEPLEDKTRIRYRIDGILQERLVLPRQVHDSLVSRIKILSEMRIDEKRVPQDGRFTFKIGENVVDLRISTLPTVYGEKVVMRLLSKTTKAPTLMELGLRGNALKSLEQNIIRSHGIVLITGPTGSGKTTTLYSILTKINNPKVNIVTLEDPVEYQIPGVNQVQINPAAGLTFANGLRSFLRQDPNIIMVGEIRDNETADLAIQASLTGHLVFSTVHTNSAAGALPRLLDMGMETFLLASSMLAVVAQRVLRSLCINCREEFTPPEVILSDIQKNLGSLIKCDGVNCTLFYEGNTDHQAHQLKLYRARGCEKCGQTGYQGRVGIFEVLNINDKIGKLIMARSTASQIEQEAVQEGMLTMIQDGYLKAIEGKTTIEEVLRVARA